MANNYTSLKLSYTNAYDFKETFSDYEIDHIRYLFIGNSTPYSNVQVVPDIIDSSVNEKSVWDNMFAAKKITGNDVEMVVPRIDWTANTVYKQYDDTLDLELLVPDNDGSNSIYVITDEYNVYKCVDNNNSAQSSDKPTGDLYTSNGYITTTDGYVWKYLYNVKRSNKFLTETWIPAPTSVSKMGYNTNVINLVDGALASIIVTNTGSGYIHSTVNVSSFLTGCTVLTVEGTVNVAQKFATNMVVSGTGILPKTLVTNVDPINNRITISNQTIADGGGTNTANSITATTGIIVSGDGNDDITTTVTLANTTISRIAVDSVGTGYTFANVAIYGTGTGATARAVLAPKFGHGFNPAKELGSKYVMVSKTIGSTDSTEGGFISVDTSFRQFGLLSNPHKYNDDTSVSFMNANTIISQTTDLTMISGLAYDLNEFVYQGSSANNSTFSGIVHAQDSNIVRLTNVRGTVSIGGLLVGANSGIQRAVVTVDSPEFQPYTGDILYVENTLGTNRADGQAENIKFVVKF